MHNPFYENILLYLQTNILSKSLYLLHELSLPNASDINQCLISQLRTFYKQFARSTPREIYRNHDSRDNRANLSATEIYSLICEFLSGKTSDVDANRRPYVRWLIISKDTSEVDAPCSFVPLFCISMLESMQERLRSPGGGGLQSDFSTPREAVPNCIKEWLRGVDSSRTCSIVAPFDLIIIIDLAAKKKIRRNINKPRDNTAARTDTYIRFISLFECSSIALDVVLEILPDKKDTCAINLFFF